MSEEKKEKPESAPAPAPKKDGKDEKKKGGFTRKFLVFTLLVTAAVFLPSTIVGLVCMLPSLVAGVVDRQPQRTSWITVGVMNFAGTLPAWFMLWSQGQDLATAMQMITRPTVLLTAYGGAAIGLLIYNYVTPLVAGVVVSRNEKRLKDIDKRQKELIRKWGEDVAGW